MAHQGLGNRQFFGQLDNGSRLSRQGHENRETTLVADGPEHRNQRVRELPRGLGGTGCTGHGYMSIINLD